MINEAIANCSVSLSSVPLSENSSLFSIVIKIVYIYAWGFQHGGYKKAHTYVS